ncbi:GGDEF domain-containing protein [Kitasatospora sp. NPDC088783]|uniref:GGDEF domain-containing protein n=1 Tax=Kitasatospora sp. NPDC088783 TaxID=3364077 RepID=UPI00382053E1
MDPVQRHTARLALAAALPLAGLPTRDGFTRAARRLARHPEAAVILIDLDGFKKVNDTCGHQAGDAILRAAADALDLISGTDGCAARLGGDEFAVITTLPQHRVPFTMSKLKWALSAPIPWDGAELRVGASIGVARLADLPQPTVGDALAAADTAMYHAKHNGGGWHQHTPDTDTTQRRWQRTQPAA